MGLSYIRSCVVINSLVSILPGSIKKLIEATGGFKVRKRAWSTIQGFEGIRFLQQAQVESAGEPPFKL
ncbi:hypothetical protein BS333_03335 [Vibrio azureus]|nr:hypothetical protein BS333_03335 [Vibrio azureus]